jgi:hypothetical protein
MNKDTETRVVEWRGGANPEGGPDDDRLRKVVHAALAIYLLPALLVVMVVGGVMVVATGAARVALRGARALGWASRAPLAAVLPRRVKPPLGDRNGRFPVVAPQVPAAQRSRGPSARN